MSRMDTIDIATATPEKTARRPARRPARGQAPSPARGVVRTKAERRAIYLETLLDAKPDRRVWRVIEGLQIVIAAFAALVACVAIVAGLIG